VVPGERLRSHNHGFALVGVQLATVVLAAIALIAWYVWDKSHTSATTASAEYTAQSRKPNLTCSARRAVSEYPTWLNQLCTATSDDHREVRRIGS
jgi:hypothetical protein